MTDAEVSDVDLPIEDGEDLMSRLAAKYGALVISEEKKGPESRLERAIRVRKEISISKGSCVVSDGRDQDIERIRAEFSRIDHDLRLITAPKRGFLARFRGQEKPYYDSSQLDDRIQSAFTDFRSYVQFQLKTNQDNHEELVAQTMELQKKQLDIIQRKDTLEVELDEVTSLVQETSERIASYKGAQMTSETAEERILLKRYHDNLVRDMEKGISFLMQSYDTLASLEESIAMMDFLKSINNMVNVQQMAALGEAQQVVQEYEHQKGPLRRIQQNADFAIKIYEVTGLIKNHVDSGFTESKARIEQLKNVYDSRISERRRELSGRKRERLELLGRIDDSFLKRAAEYRDLVPVYQ